ncbi:MULTISPECIES: FAD-linked oxidase C-terminal domain-containing protein [unclassified Variovorax]|uniref:FAD-linked oxidase C-terminal domain-containing protein n=1 Tax=Variovorax atrisoli TaxID=3394203 RepID=UPI00339AA3FC
MCDRIVYEALHGRSDTVSAEHGVGRLEKEVLCITRGDNQLALARRMKAALDPAGILNAGRVMD